MLKKQNYYYLNNRWRNWDNNITKSLIKDVLEVAKAKQKTPIRKMKVLDMGSGAGNYSLTIEKKVAKVVAIEPYKEAFRQLRQNKKASKSKVLIKNTLVENFKTKERFDLVLSITTLEHMPHPKKSFTQLFKLIKPGGIIYLTVPNKLWPIEPHYKLPFLSMLPLPIANQYVRLFQKASSYEDSSYAMTYWQIRKFFSQFPCTYEFRLPDENAEYLGLAESSKLYGFMKNNGIKLIRRWPFLWAFSKGFILIIKKNE